MLDDLISLVYDKLHSNPQGYMRHERIDRKLQSVTLLNAVFVRIATFASSLEVKLCPKWLKARTASSN